MARGFLLLFLCASGFGETLEDAVRALAKSMSVHLAANEIAHVTTRNISSLARGEVMKVQPLMEQALRKRVRAPGIVEITLTISENRRGYLLVAELKRGAEAIIEMTPFRAEPPPPPGRGTLTLQKRMLWEQTAPILDIALMNDQMLVLDTDGLTRYVRGQAVETVSTPFLPVRDPRGRIAGSGESFTILLPGTTCNGTWGPLALRCEQGGPIVAGRNTFAGLNPLVNPLEDPHPFFSEAQIGEVQLMAETDGRTHIYDAARNPAGTIDDWGSDFAVLLTCAGTRLAVSSSGDRDSADDVVLFDLVHTVPIRVSDPAGFPGPVTALWPMKDGALVVARNLATGRYEAYRLAVDCGR